MAKAIKKILASVSAALMLGGIVTKAPSSKANAMFGVPAYQIPVGQTYAIPVATPVCTIYGTPRPLSLPRNYSHNFIICNNVRCPIVIRNGQYCYQLGNHFYPIYYY